MICLLIVSNSHHCCLMVCTFCVARPTTLCAPPSCSDRSLVCCLSLWSLLSSRLCFFFFFSPLPHRPLAAPAAHELHDQFRESHDHVRAMLEEIRKLRETVSQRDKEIEKKNRLVDQLERKTAIQQQKEKWEQVLSNFNVQATRPDQSASSSPANQLSPTTADQSNELANEKEASENVKTKKEDEAEDDEVEPVKER